MDTAPTLELAEIVRPENVDELGTPGGRTDKHVPMSAVMGLCASQQLDKRKATQAVLQALACGNAHAFGWAELQFWDEQPLLRSTGIMVIPTQDWDEIQCARNLDNTDCASSFVEGRNQFYDEYRRIDWRASEASYSAYGCDNDGYPTFKRMSVTWRDISINRDQLIAALSGLDPTLAKRRAPKLVRPTKTDAQIETEMRKMLAAGQGRDAIARAVPNLPGFEGVTNEQCRRIFRERGLRARGRPKRNSP